MKKIGIGIFFTLFSLTFTQTYCTGDQISLEHQNSPLVVGAGWKITVKVIIYIFLILMVI